jgi:hypothetical protein
MLGGFEADIIPLADMLLVVVPAAAFLVVGLGAFPGGVMPTWDV